MLSRRLAGDGRETRWKDRQPGSAQAFTGSETRANYTAAKLGVVGFSKSLALEVISLGITVNVVSPGLVATERVRSRFSDGGMARSEFLSTDGPSGFA